MSVKFKVWIAPEYSITTEPVTVLEVLAPVNVEASAVVLSSASLASIDAIGMSIENESISPLLTHGCSIPVM